jgi:hypothetical protein
MRIALPQLTLQQKWETAESNLAYFIVCGISYAKAHGQTAANLPLGPAKWQRKTTSRTKGAHYHERVQTRQSSWPKSER